MTISVLMSVYRSEKAEYFSLAMKSIWDDQTLKPDKIILIEDGALSEELYTEIDSWQAKLQDKLLILKNEENLGLTKSLNKGIKYVTTDLIARMDSDDISMPNRFQLQHDFLEKNKDIDVVGGSLQEFNEENNCLTVRNFPTNPNEIKKYIRKASPLAHPTVMMRADMFKQVQYNEKYRTSQDIALWFDALAKGFKISNVENVTLMFRRSEAMLKRRNKSKAINEFKIYMKGLRKLYGLFSFAYIYPLMRLCFRLLPQSVIKFIYDSEIRGNLLNITAYRGGVIDVYQLIRDRIYAKIWHLNDVIISFVSLSLRQNVRKLIPVSL